MCLGVQTCCCGKDVRSVLCGSQESFETRYMCGGVCGRSLSCGQHRCNRPCHAGPCDECSLLPDRVTHCPCGKTALVDIPAAKPRRSCTDNIPTCQLTCLKLLQCGTAGKIYMLLVFAIFHVQTLMRKALNRQHFPT